jgi:outer membrane lipoprotein-sorting protein
LHEADYSKGHLYVLTIPDNFSDLYNLPAEALNKIRQILCGKLNVQIEGPSKISLYVYDNNTFIVESFLDKETVVKAVTPSSFTTITDLTNNQVINGELRKPGFSYIERNSGEKNIYTFTLKPHSFRVFRMQ